MIYHNDTPLATEGDLLRMCDEYGLRMDDITQIVDQMEEHGFVEDIEGFEDRAKAIAFYSSLSKQGPSPEEKAPSAELSTQVISAAVSGIVGQLPLGFLVSKEGRITIDKDNPPRLEDAYEAGRTVMGGYDVAIQLQYFSMEALGSFIVNCEEYFGEDFDISQIADLTDRSKDSLERCRKGYLFMKEHGKRPKLTFTHHVEMEYANLKPRKKQEVLDLSEKWNLTVAKQRVIARAAQNGLMQEMKEADNIDDLMKIATPSTQKGAFLAIAPDRFTYLNGYADLHKVPDWARYAVQLPQKRAWKRLGKEWHRIKHVKL